ncbi:hypothetical protein ACI780_09740 [Geodermatophilus sp. SYSU D00814]
MTGTVAPIDAERGRGAHPTAGPDERSLGAGARRLLTAFALLTALATHQLLVQGGHTDRQWAWTIQARPTAAFLGAAYAAGLVLSVLSLRQRSWERVRVAVGTVTAFTVLTLAATYWHAHRLHLTAADPGARAAAWVWVAVYLTVPVCGVVVLVRQRGSRGPGAVRSSMPVWLRWVLAAQGVALGSVGAVLFALGLTLHHGTHPMAGFWPWPLTPLSAQVVGAWLIALAVGAGLVIRERDLGRLRVPAIAYAAFGAFQWAVLLRYQDEMRGGPSLWVYGALLTVVVATGAYGWWAVGRRPA